MTTIIYTRFSPRPDDTDVQSLSVQTSVCESYCRLRELGDVQVLQDPEVSARRTPLKERPSGAILCRMVEDGEVEHVVCQKLDRIFRSTTDGLLTIERWQELGVSLHLADQGGNSLNTSTATGELMLTMLLGFAKFEPRLISERTSQSMLKQQAAGRKMGGKPPYGMRAEGKELVEDSVEQDCIRKIMGMAGAMGPQSIATAMNNAGYFARGGKFWHHSTVSKVIERHRQVLVQR